MTGTTAMPARPSATHLTVLVALGAIAGLMVALGGPRAAGLVVAALVAAAAAVLAPGCVFALYLLIPFYKGAAQAYAPVDITVVLALLTTLQLVPVVRDAGWRHVPRAGIALWVALALLILGGVLYAPDQSIALNHAVAYWVLVFVPLLVGTLRVGYRPRFVHQLLWTFFAMGVLATVIGLMSISSSDRLVVLGANTINTAAAALLVPLVGLTFVFRHGSWPLRLATLLLTPAALVVALASGSRGPLLVLLVLALLGVVRYVTHARAIDWRRSVAITGGVLAAILVISFASSYLPVLSINRFTLFAEFVQGAITGDPAGTTSVDTSTATRLALYGVAIGMFEERPILGFGTAGFEAMSNRLVGHQEAYPHDALLQFGAEFGIVGALLFVGLVTAALTRRLPEIGAPVKVLFLYFLLQAMIGGDIFSDRATWGLLLLLLLLRAPSFGHVAFGATRVGTRRSALATDGVGA